MALARFGRDSNVYIFYHAHGGITCCGCSAASKVDITLQTEEEMLDHVNLHRRRGEIVPYTVDKYLTERILIKESNEEEDQEDQGPVEV
jgi:hypothetical protein